MSVANAVSTEFADLKASAPFRRMTGPQQAWLLEYLRTGSIHAATRAAYRDAKNSSQATMAYQIQKSQAILDCLDWYRFRDATSSRQALIDLVRKQLDAAEPGSVSAQRLCSQLQSLTLGAKTAPEPETPRPALPDSKVPTGATPLVDGNGVVRGYRTADGQYVQLASVEVDQ
jgi:hypothetical protein